jgi:hypothetical protein
MNRKDVLNWIESEELNKETLLEEKFDNAISGHNCNKIIYNIDKMNEILIKEGMNEEESNEFLEKNYFSIKNDVIYMFPYNKKTVDNFVWFKSLVEKIKK